MSPFTNIRAILKLIATQRGSNHMIELWKEGLWQQFGAAIDYLAATVAVCPDDLWRASLWKTPGKAPEFAQFW
jgi:hypothetical protein